MAGTSQGAIKGWETRRENQRIAEQKRREETERRSMAAKKAWRTRKKNKK